MWQRKSFKVQVQVQVQGAWGHYIFYVTYELAQYVRVFVIGKLFQLGVI